MSNAHLFLHNNFKHFTSSTLSSYTGYQSGTKSYKYKGFMYKLKPKEIIHFLDLSNKSHTNMINYLKKLKPPEKYIENILNILSQVCGGRASLYNRMPNTRYSQNNTNAYGNMYNLVRRQPRLAIKKWIRDIVLELGFDGIYEGDGSYNSYLLFNTSKLSIDNKRVFKSR